MPKPIEIALSTNNLNIINKICRTEYKFNSATDLDLLTLTQSKLHGIHVLTANNFILLIQNSQKYFPLPYVANITLIQPFEGKLDCEYLTFELGIFYSDHLVDIFGENFEYALATIEAEIEFVRTKVGRASSK